MKKHLLGAIAIVFAVAGFAFTNSNKAKPFACDQNLVWYAVSTEISCSQYTSVQLSSLIIDSKYDRTANGSNKTIDLSDVDFLNEGLAASSFGCPEVVPDIVCIVGYRFADIVSDASGTHWVPNAAPVCVVCKEDLTN